MTIRIPRAAAFALGALACGGIGALIALLLTNSDRPAAERTRVVTRTVEAPRAPARELDLDPGVRAIQTVLLTPVDGGGGNGTAVLAEDADGKTHVVVQARGLPSKKSGEAYEVWLYNSRSDVRSLGAQTTNRAGFFQGTTPVRLEDVQEYRYMDISRERIDNNREHSGESVLRGEF